MTGKIVCENLKHQPMRSLLSFLLIGVPVNLILCLVGLSTGMLEDSKDRQRAIGADVVVLASSASAINASSAAALSDKIADGLERLPHVRIALGVFVKMADFPNNIMGIDLPKFEQMSGGFRYLEGGPIHSPDDILIDDRYAAQKGKHAGDMLRLLNREWHIAGVVKHGKLANIIAEKSVLQDLDSATGKVTNIFVKLDDPTRAEAAVAEFKSAMGPNYTILTMEDFMARFDESNIPGVKAFRYVIMGIGVVIGFFVVSLSMYMAVLQRTREIGILKSMGASDSFVVGIILSESLVLGIGGTLMGIIMSFGSWWLIGKLAPASIPMVIVPSWWPIAGGITLVAAVLGGLYPGLKAAHHDTIQALAYE